MSLWVDYNMIMSEIVFQRENAQDRIKFHKTLDDPTEVDEMLYREAIGKEVALMYLQQWCNDFKFSFDEIKELEKSDQREKILQQKEINSVGYI